MSSNTFVFFSRESEQKSFAQMQLSECRNDFHDQLKQFETQLEGFTANLHERFTEVQEKDGIIMEFQKQVEEMEADVVDKTKVFYFVVS